MELRSQPFQGNFCIFFRQYFCCRRKRRWNPINQRNPKVKRERSRVTFAARVNKVEPVHSTIEEVVSEDDSVHTFTYENSLSPEHRSHDDHENASTVALLDQRLSDSSDSESESEAESEREAGEILTLEAFVEKYVKDTIAAAMDQWKRDYQHHKETLEIEELDDDDTE